MSRDQAYVTHILECVGKIRKWHSEGKEVFVDDEKTRDAIIRNLQIMAESTKRISDKLKQAHSEVDWRTIADFRNIVVHEYLGLDVDIIWSIIERDLPPLKGAMEKMLKELT